MSLPSAPPPPATLFARYLAQCEADTRPLLSAVCLEASRSAGTVGGWLSPAEQMARQVLPGLPAVWAQYMTERLAWAAQPDGPASSLGGPISLSLMSDDDVDEDIESTRIVQGIESAAEWTLRDLRARLAQWPSGGGRAPADRLPLAPEAVVAALGAALRDGPWDGSLRLAVLRAVSPPLGRALADLYARHAALLADWGLAPARYTIRRDPEPAAQRPAGGAVPVASSQIPELLVQVGEQAGLTRGMQALLTRLAGPVERSIAADAGLLASMENPLWRLVDRLAALGQVDDAGDSVPLHERLEPIIARLEQAAQPMAVGHYEQALVEAEALSAADTASTTAAVLAGQPAAGLDKALLESMERRQALEPMMRAQMVARLRDDPLLPEVKQFLLGPWMSVLLQAVCEGGEDAPQARRVLGAVESLVAAGRLDRSQPLTPAEIDCLRMEAEDGLSLAGLPALRIQQHAADLTAALKTWPREAVDSGLHDIEPEPVEDSEASDWPSHADLATVPIALDAQNPDDPARRDCEAWLDGLAVGDICRIHRQGQWTTLRLNWRSDNGAFYAFANQGGLAFCASRRVLTRLRLEGLATTMTRGQWVRRAVDTLPMPLG